MLRMGRGASVEPSEDDQVGEECLDEDALLLGTYGVPAQLVDSYEKRWTSEEIGF